MTDQITAPRETWDAMREALKLCYEHCRVYHPEVDTNNVGQSVRQALTAAASVSHPKPETTPLPEGGAITSESTLALLVKEMRYIATITNGQAHRIAMMTLEKVAAANAVSEQPKPVALQWVAEMIMSDCGCSTNNERLLERVIGRIEQYERANGPAHPQATEQAKRCWCETCRPLTIGDMRMIVCPDCGNKRCPKATHHDNACTNSNDIGQKGSSWEHVRPVVKESLTARDLDTCRQWFDSVQDTNGGYLTLADYVLADKIYRTLGMRVPSSITAMLAAAPEAKQ